MKFRPLHDRVVVRRIEDDTKTKGGIIIPDTAKEKPVQVNDRRGPGVRDDSGKLTPLDVKAGDRVLFGKWSGTEVKIHWRRIRHYERERYPWDHRISRAHRNCRSRRGVPAMSLLHSFFWGGVMPFPRERC